MCRKTERAVPNLDVVNVGYDKFVWKITELAEPSAVLTMGGKRVELFREDQYAIEKPGGSKFGLKEIWATGTILNGISSGRFFRDHLAGRYVEDGYGVLYKVHGLGTEARRRDKRQVLSGRAAR